MKILSRNQETIEASPICILLAMEISLGIGAIAPGERAKTLEASSAKQSAHILPKLWVGEKSGRFQRCGLVSA